MGTGGTTQLSPLDFVKVCSGQRQPIALRFQLALLGRFRIRAVSESTAPFRVCLFDSSAYPQNYTEDSMEHFRVMTKLRMLSTFVCLAAVSSGQRQPIALRFQLALLGRFRTRGVRGFALRIRRPCESSPRRISTGRLHALRRFHSPPINLIVFEAPYRIAP